MKLVSLIHPSLNKMGGAEKILLEIMRILKDKGYDTVLYTIDRVNWERLEQKWGTDIRPDNEVHYLDEMTPVNALDWGLSTIIYLWMLWRAQQEEGISLNNYGEIFPFISDISYIHSQPLYTNRKNSFNLPFWPYSDKLYGWLFNRLRKHASGKIISNSGYTARLVKSMGLDSTIIYPFVEPVKTKAYKRGDVLTVSRISWGKNLDTLFNVAALCRGIRFRIAGTISQNALDLVKEINRSKRFDFSANPSRSELETNMAESSIYFSTQPNETFGMSIVEAMSAGCVPIVYRDGGPWYDILEEKEDAGFAYSSPDEAAEKIRLILGDEELRNQMRLGAAQRSAEFTIERFREGIQKVVQSITPRERKDGRLVKFCRWVDENKKYIGF